MFAYNPGYLGSGQHSRQPGILGPGPALSRSLGDLGEVTAKSGLSFFK